MAGSGSRRPLITAYDVLCCLYPTAPFVAPGDLVDAFSMFVKSGAPSVIPVTNYDFPPQRAFSVLDDGTIEYAEPEHALSRSQDLPERVHDCGSFYIADAREFATCKSLVMRGSISFRVPAAHVQDIDTEDDWAIAETKYAMLVGGAKGGLGGRSSPPLGAGSPLGEPRWGFSGEAR